LAKKRLLPPAALPHLFGPSRQFREAHVKRVGELEEVQQAGVPLTTLDPRDVRAVEIGGGGKCLLRKIPLCPELT